MNETIASWYRDLPGWRRTLAIFFPVAVVIGMLAYFVSEFKRGYAGDE